MKYISKLFLFSFVIMAFAFAGCDDPGDEAIDDELYDENNDGTENTAFQSGNDMNNGMSASNKAIAVINSDVSNAGGWVSFTKMGNGVRVHAELSGLSGGEHGFHIHQYGDCSADDYSSAGGHYNPTNEEHGARTDSIRHMGDMGNITASGQSATLDYTDSVIRLNRIIGRAVILHQGTDDLSSQPSGAAGSRIACGVIGYANADNMNGNMNNMDGGNM